MVQENIYKKVSFKVEKVSCNACLHTVIDQIEGMEGVEYRKFKNGRLHLRYDLHKSSIDNIVDALTDIGHPPKNNYLTKTKLDWYRFTETNKRNAFDAEQMHGNCAQCNGGACVKEYRKNSETNS